MSLNIYSVYAFFPPKMIINMESVGLSSELEEKVSALRKFDFIRSVISNVAGSYNSAIWPYLGLGLKPEFKAIHSPTWADSVYANEDLWACVADV